MFLLSQHYHYIRDLEYLKLQTDLRIKGELIKLSKDLKREVNNVSLAVELGLKGFYKYTLSYPLLLKGLKETRKTINLKNIFFINPENKILIPEKRTYELGVIPPQWIDVSQFYRIDDFLNGINEAIKKKEIVYKVVFLPHFIKEVSSWRKEPFLIIITPIFLQNVYKGSAVGILNLKNIFKNYIISNSFLMNLGKIFFVVLDSKDRIIYSKEPDRKWSNYNDLNDFFTSVKVHRYHVIKFKFSSISNENWTFILGYPVSLIQKNIQPFFIKNIIWSFVAVFLVCIIFTIITIINNKNLSLISRYHQAVENLMDPFILMDTKGFIINSNESFKKTFRDNINNIEDLFRVQSEESELTTKEELVKKLSRGEPFTTIHSFELDDGDLRHFRLMFSPVRNKYGKLEFVSLDFNDITEIVVLEKKLKDYANNLERMVEERTKEIKEREKEYHQIFENQMLGIAILDLKGELLLYNTKFKLLSEYSDEELNNINFKELCSPTDKDMLMSLFNACLNKGEVFQGEIKFFPKRKRTIFVDMFLQRTIYRGQNTVLVFIYDVTKRKILENKLREQERIAILGEMAAGVAHDINNLFMAISGHLELALNLLEEDASKDRARKHIDSSFKSLREGENIVRRLYAYAQKQIRSSEVVDLNRLLQETVELIKPLWKNVAERTGKGIQLIEDYGTLNPIVGSSAEIKEVFVNIIKNAIDAMPEGGKIFISTFQEGNKNCVVIKDTGSGIPEDIRFKIFEPFFTTKGSKGSGLGLAVSLGIVKAYGGNIKVESEEGKGTTFTVYFPVVSEDLFISLEEHEKENVELSSGKTKKVLVVEDEKEVLDVIKNLIELLGVDVFACSSPKEALDLFSKYKKDIGLVITDLGMPEMSGFEFCKKLKTLDPKMKIVLLTGWGLTIDDLKKKEHGIEEILSKPITLEDLKRILNRFL